MLRPIVILTLGLPILACTAPDIPSSLASPDRVCFDERIYPILITDCGYSGCHGNEERPFRVFGPGRARLSAVPMDVDLETAERDATYARARSMIAESARPDESLLVRKPLDVQQGGGAHQGIDAFGRDVYLDTTDENYQLLLSWVLRDLTGCGEDSPDGGL